jgi:hypothetical protein
MAAMWLNSGTQDATGTLTGEDRNLILDKSLVVGLTGTQPNCSSLADCISEGSQGSLLQVDGGILSNGTRLDPDNFWFSGTGGSDISAVLGTGVDTQLVAVNAGLSTLFNTVMPIVPQNKASGTVNPLCVTNTADGCVDLKLSATVNGGTNTGVALANGAFAYSTSITAQKYVAVPEPGTLSLLGAALLGLCGFARRKSKS